ncbi:MAG TPA: ATP-binding protein [Kofleriaceae bacterium]|nr:ATP-binding protein [Kofleriaceae bacterium]
MKEVSCRVFEILIGAVEEKGIALERMVAGTDVPIAILKNKHERITWQDTVTIMRNMSTAFSEEEYVEIGRQHLRSRMLRFVFVVARLRFTPIGFYKWMNKPKEGVGNQLFTCITPHHRDISDTECECDLILQDGYPDCPEFFMLSRGNFMEMPRLLGYPEARVTMTRLAHGARYHITIAEKASLLGRIGRTVSLPFTVGAAAKELQEAHTTLRDRYEQLETAKTALEQQRALLDTAYRVGQRIWSERDPLSTSSAIVNAMVTIAGYADATLDVAPSDAPTMVERAAAGGERAGARLALDLSQRGRLIGGLVVHAGQDADPHRARQLLDLLAPTLAIALDNAFAYRSLAEYQRGLEQKVAERTAELRAAHDSLAATVKQLEEARDARERIFANVSHEIRTPLSLILLAVGDIEAHAALDDSARASARSIEVSARKLLRLVDELLLLAAGQAQSLRLRPEPTDVSALITTLGATWKPATDESGVTLGIDAAPDLIAMIDPVAVERIVSNLLSNAVKYTPRGGTIALGLAAASGDRVAIRVRDSGVGIDDELLPRLFGRFEQGTSSAQVRGSGIGLSLVKELAQAQGGDVTVLRHRPGTEFTVTLPATTARPVAAGSPTLRPSDFGQSATTIASGAIFEPREGTGGTKILVAEDDPALARSIAHLLAEDYTVVVGLDGQAALELAQRHQPHLLVTDVEMPKLNGIDLTRRFRDLPGNGMAPIVMLSALADIKDRITGLEAGAIDYVTKPFDPRELKARVRAQLDMRNLNLRLHRAEQLAALGTLSAGLAHELRNPANGIVNAIPPLREVLPPELTGPESPSGQLLDVLAGCAEQIASLSKQLLGFRRGGELDLRTVPLGDVVHRAISLVSPALRGIEVRDRVGAQTPIRCAPPLFVQVLTNLVENAAHAAGKGGWVEIASRAGGGRIVVEVSDSGPGVPHELRERIFEPFFTTKAPGVGTGLGLPVARDIITRHGGVLEVRERGDRPVFVIDLPHRESAATEPS